MDNPEKLATQDTQDEDKQNKKTQHNYVLETTVRKQTQNLLFVLPRLLSRGFK